MNAHDVPEWDPVPTQPLSDALGMTEASRLTYEHLFPELVNVNKADADHQRTAAIRRQEAEASIVNALLARELVACFRENGGAWWRVPQQYWTTDNATCSFWNGRLQPAGALFETLDGFGGPSCFLDRAAFGAWLKKPTADSTRKPKRSGGRDYRLKDAQHIKEMRRLLIAGDATTVWDAALAVARSAIGSGNDSSKAKRLSKRYKERHPS